MDLYLQWPASADGLSSIFRSPCMQRPSILAVNHCLIDSSKRHRILVLTETSCHNKQVTAVTEKFSGSQIRRLGTTPTETPTTQTETWASIVSSHSQSLLPVLSYKLKECFYFNTTSRICELTLSFTQLTRSPDSTHTPTGLPRLPGTNAIPVHLPTARL